MVSQNRCIFLGRIWKIEDIQIVETVPCSLFPVPYPHRQLIQQTLSKLFDLLIATVPSLYINKDGSWLYINLQQ
jgi:hypothetical protein